MIRKSYGSEDRYHEETISKHVNKDVKYLIEIPKKKLRIKLSHDPTIPLLGV